MTKTERNQLHWALVGARETILALTDGTGRIRREAKEDSPLVVDRITACIAILPQSETE